MKQYISEIDTQRFGISIARINVFENSPLEDIQKLKDIGVQLVISRVPGHAIQLINDMEQCGFRLKDVQATYVFDSFERIPYHRTDEYLYRDFDPLDRSDIVRIATAAFPNYGHYAKLDIPGGVDTGAIYADWADRICRGELASDKIIVAESKGEIAGFLGFNIRKDAGKRYASGNIGALATAHRGSGVFRNINIAGLHWAAEQGLQWMEHNVLITNAPVNKTYSSLGFYLSKSEVTLHCLLDESLEPTCPAKTQQ